MTLKKSNKYSYISGKQVTNVDTGTRYYDFQGMKLPSVTTVLAKTKNQAYLTRWKNKVGHDKAEQIKNLSSKRGTAMHKFLESHIQGVGYDDLTANRMPGEAHGRKNYGNGSYTYFGILW